MAELFRAWLSQEVVQLAPGGPPVQVLLTVQNLGTGIEDYQIEVELEGRRPAWPEWITPSPAKLIGLYPVGTPDQQSEGQVAMTIQPPADLDWVAGSHPVRLRVVPVGDPGRGQAVTLQLEMPAAYDLALHLDPEQQSGLLEDSFWLEATNRGNVPLSLRFEASDDRHGCTYGFEPAELSVPVGGKASVELNLRARASLTQPGGVLHRFTVTARLVQDPSRSWQITGRWQQVAPSLRLTLTPKEGRGPTKGEFSLQVSNPGEADLNVQLKVKQPERKGEYIVQPAQVAVPSGGSAGSTLTITPKAGVQGGRTFPFVITAQAVEAPAAMAEQPGEWVWTPPPSKRKRRVWPFIVAGALLVLAIILADTLSRDRQFPHVIISAEPTEAEVGQEVTFTAQASDNRELGWLSIVVDGVDYPCEPPDSKCSVGLAFSEAGEVTYYAVATDRTHHQASTGYHKIDVVSPPGGAVTSIWVPTGSIDCVGTRPVECTVHAEIVTDGPAEVECQWELPGGAVIEAPLALSFQAAGSQGTLLRWSVHASGVYEVRLHVLSPNDMYSDPVEVEVKCEAPVTCPITDQEAELTILDATGLSHQLDYIKAVTLLQDRCPHLTMTVAPASIDGTDPSALRALIEVAVAGGTDIAVVSSSVFSAIRDQVAYYKDLSSGRTLAVLNGSRNAHAAEKLVDWLVAESTPPPEPVLVPDLTVKSITFDPMPPIENQKCKVRILILNVGEGAADAFGWEWQPGSASPLSGHVAAGLEAGGSTIVTAEWVPVSWYSSLSTVARVDPATAVPESKEDNNGLQRTVEVVKRLPDLEITWIKVTSEPMTNDTVRVTVEFHVTNTGNEATPSGWIFLRVWANGSPTPPFMALDGPIQPGGRKDGQFIVKDKSLWRVGINEVRVEVDYKKTIEESDETNNISHPMKFPVLPSVDS
jgi:hypothetical protein